MKMFFLLMFGHAIADFALQTDWIAKTKNRHAGAPQSYNPKLHGPIQTIWPYVLSAHALIHGGMVFLVTGSVVLGFAETIAHWAIDFGKCEKWYGIHTDQALHIFCKIIWICFFQAVLTLKDVR